MSNFITPLGVKGRFYVRHLDNEGRLKGSYQFPNGIVDVGMNHILDTQFHGGTPITTWYIALIDLVSYSALADADTMASHAGWIENTDYTGSANRPAWVEDAAAARAITNSTTTDFAINATVSLKGIFITGTSATVPGNTGVLWSTALFASTVAAVNGDTLKITYTVSG